MKVLIVLSAFAAVAYASSGIITGTHLAYVNLVPGAPTGPDGRVVDTPEVAVAKAEHAAAHINEKFTLANVAARNYAVPAVVSAYAAPGLVSAYASPLAYARVVPGAPIGLDGRVVDTPEVAVAKAEHHAAHINEKVTLANQAARNYAIPSVISAYSTPLLNKYVY